MKLSLLIKQLNKFSWYTTRIFLLLTLFFFIMDFYPIHAQDAVLTADELERIELSTETLSAGIAWGDPNGTHSTYSWPFTVVQMGHAIQSFQNYGSTTADSYFHHGIDMIAPNGTQVFNRSGGQVVNVENYTVGNDLYWEVAILDPEGYVWQYHHIDKNTIPQSIKDKFAEWQVNHTTGGFIPANTYIGNIVLWTVSSFGYIFNHVHLNVLGAGDIYLNTMEFHTPLNDTQAPEILTIGLTKSNTVISGTGVSGEYGLYARARDLFLSTVYYLPPYKVEFSIDDGPWTTTWDFHNLPGGANNKAYVNDFYVYPPTCGNYSCRDFYIDLGFTNGLGIFSTQDVEAQRTLPTTMGDHAVQVRVWDYNSNSATSSFTWTIYNEYANTTSTPIPDNSCTNGTGVYKTINVAEEMILTDVNVGINITHATRGQLQITLKAPDDTTATTIVTSATDNYDNYDLLLADSSILNINDGSNDTVATPNYEGDRRAGPRPDGSLNSFSGKNSLGTWTLYVCDNTNGTSGTINQVKLMLLGNYNRAPNATINATSPLNIISPVLNLSGSITDDGLPKTPGQVTSTWSVVSAPSNGAWAFSNSQQSGTAPMTHNTSITFTQPGTYLLQLSATDNSLASATAQVQVNAQFTPTGVNVADFIAQYISLQAVRISWQATLEESISGYNLYRSTTLDGARQLLTATPIPVKVDSDPNDYHFIDNSVINGLPYFYWLAELVAPSNEEYFMEDVPPAIAVYHDHWLYLPYTHR
jgi:subtilisin-like proprotein convertase family protein